MTVFVGESMMSQELLTESFTFSAESFKISPEFFNSFR